MTRLPWPSMAEFAVLFVSYSSWLLPQPLPPTS
jgi:hypothetical protein